MEGGREFAVLQPGDLKWRPSNMMQLPNTNLLEQRGGAPAQ